VGNRFLNSAPFALTGRRTILLAPGDFSTFGAKTAVCYLRYRGGDVVAVVDPVSSGRRVEEVVGFGGDVPVVADVRATLAFDPEISVVGVAPRGGALSGSLRAAVLDSVAKGLDVVSGLHDFLSEDREISAAARKSGSRLWDVRMAPPVQSVGTGRGCVTGARTVLTVGSDCNVGKMTVTVELFDQASRQGLRAAWAATGQTGIMLRERGVCVDRVIADFVGGVAEELVNYEGRDHDLLFVEGQGSLLHPGYAGVTLGLMYGVMPDCMVLVHAASRVTIGDSPVVVPPLGQLVTLHEATMAPFKKSPVVAIALNTAGLENDAARDIIEKASKETRLPVSDPIRFGSRQILDAVVGQFS
jgi:uncharacterized NAD-dependent epimerase/dehydratase family protein